MLSINNNNCDYKERERHVIELYDQGKSTRDIAKELRMSLRDISAILRKNQVTHGIPFPIIDNDNNNNNNKPPNQKFTQAYKLFSEGYKRVYIFVNYLVDYVFCSYISCQVYFDKASSLFLFHLLCIYILHD
jgi:hypothetical protein